MYCVIFDCLLQGLNETTTEVSHFHLWSDIILDTTNEECFIHYTAHAFISF